MPHFNVIGQPNDINVPNSWVESKKFLAKDRIVDDNGKKADANYAGRRYQLISKKERKFSGFERFGRGFLGTLAVVASLGLALIAKSIRNLFTKEKQTRRFGVLMHNPEWSKIASKKINSIEIPKDKISMGYGEYMVYRNQDGCQKTDINKETYEAVYQIFNKYSPAQIINNGGTQEIAVNRYQLICEEVKKIDKNLEVAFVPRTLYELVYIRKCIEEDVKHNSVCPVLNASNMKSAHIQGERAKCWHLRSFGYQGDNNDAGVKNIAYKLNKVMIKTLCPNSGGLTHQTLLDHTDAEIAFLKDYYVKCSATMKEREEKLKNGETFNWIADGLRIGPSINFGYEFTSPTGFLNNPMSIRNNQDAEIIRNSVSLECSYLAQKSMFLYRGGEFTKDEPFNTGKHDSPYSLSYGSSLFAGCQYDGGASAFHYARNAASAYAIPVPFNEINNSAFFIPSTNAISQMQGEGESFHARTKIWKKADLVNIKGIFEYNQNLECLKSHLSRENLISAFHKHKANAISLK